MHHEEDLVAKFHRDGLVVLVGWPPVQGRGSPGLEIGIDLAEWRAAQQCRGIKLVPQGLHLLHVTPLQSGAAATAEHAMIAARATLVHWMEPGEVLPLFFSADAERFETEPVGMPAPEIELVKHRIRADAQSIDAFLGPYPAGGIIAGSGGGELGSWDRLTRHVTPKVLRRVLGGRASAWLSATDTTSYISDSVDQRSSTMAGAASNEASGTRLDFTTVDLRRSFPAETHGAVRTRFSLDKSFLLHDSVLGGGARDPWELLGEVELCFVLVLVAQVYDAFEQWKRLVAVLCQSSASLERSAGGFSGNSGSDAILDGFPPVPAAFWAEFLMVLSDQLVRMPADWSLDDLSADSFLFGMVQRILAAGSVSSGAIREAASHLESVCQKHFLASVSSGDNPDGLPRVRLSRRGVPEFADSQLGDEAPVLVLDDCQV